MIRVCDIVGYEGVSPSYFVTTCGHIISTKRNRVRKLKGRRSKDRYYTVGLYKDGVATTFLIHRIVASAYCKMDVWDEQINHIDEDKINNCYLNLEWCTISENLRHGTRNERFIKAVSGVNNYKSNGYDFYRENATRRQTFIRCCKRQGWNFDDFDEMYSGMIYEKSRSRLYYYYRRDEG